MPSDVKADPGTINVQRDHPLIKLMFADVRRDCPRRDREEADLVVKEYWKDKFRDAWTERIMAAIGMHGASEEVLTHTLHLMCSPDFWLDVALVGFMADEQRLVGKVHATTALAS